MIKVARKYPADRFETIIDWSGLVGTDTISGTPTVVPDLSGLTVENLSTTGTLTTFLVGGGTADTTGVIVAEVRTAGGKIKQVFISVTVTPVPTS
jgi:hypothetical protein